MSVNLWRKGPFSCGLESLRHLSSPTAKFCANMTIIFSSPSRDAICYLFMLRIFVPLICLSFFLPKHFILEKNLSSSRFHPRPPPPNWTRHISFAPSRKKAGRNHFVRRQSILFFSEKKFTFSNCKQHIFFPLSSSSSTPSPHISLLPPPPPHPKKKC